MNGRYILRGKEAVPCPDLIKWAMWLEHADRRVGGDRIGPLWVSTVFLGLDHSFGGAEPLLFETMILGDGGDGYQVRSSTWAEAEAEHGKAVAVARERVAKAAEMLGEFKGGAR